MIRAKLPVFLCFENRKKSFVDYFHQSFRAKNINVKIIDNSIEKCNKFNKFISVYKHLSCNSRDFELACFKRYFSAEIFLSKVKKGFIVDSDQILLSDISMGEIFPLDESLVFSRSNNNLNDLSPHFSYWTYERLREFTDFLIYMYTNKMDLLFEEYIHRKKLTNHASISDMALIYFYVMMNRVSWQNSNKVVENSYLDHNISDDISSNMDFVSNFGAKKLYIHNDKITIKASDRDITPISLHLQGKAKITSRFIFKKNINTSNIILGSLNIAKKIRDTI